MRVNSLEGLDKARQQQKNSHQKLVKTLKKKKPKDLDSQVAKLHEQEFTNFDCLTCANCCKSISPMITRHDVARIAKHLRMKEVDFISQYLYVDEEDDYVFQQTPCPFLGQDHYCSIYDVRPKACKEYPHTDRRRFVQLLNLSLKNTDYCPIVHNVFEGLKKKYIG